LREFLQQVTQVGNKPEDVMNHFWEIDNKTVEDTLFREEAQVDLSKLKKLSSCLKKSAKLQT